MGASGDNGAGYRHKFGSHYHGLLRSFPKSDALATPKPVGETCYQTTWSKSFPPIQRIQSSSGLKHASVTRSRGFWLQELIVRGAACSNIQPNIPTRRCRMTACRDTNPHRHSQSTRPSTCELVSPTLARKRIEVGPFFT